MAERRPFKPLVDGSSPSGFTMTFEELEFLRESNNIEDEWDDLSLQQAILAWQYAIGEDRMTPSVVLKTHKILMLHHLVGMDKGYFRTVPVYIGGRQGSPAATIRPLIEEWCEDVNAVLETKNAIGNVRLSSVEEEDEIKELHIRYERIHPFVDGNGRTGRIFLNWLRLKTQLPILVIKEKEKQGYYDWFK